jgi:hypothetical protein
MIIKLLEKISRSLESKNIPYMLSGSIALNRYTIPRMTLDIDIVIELGDNNKDSFISLFSENFYINHDTVNQEIKKRGMFNVIDYESGYKVDFIVRKNSEYRINEFQRRKKEKIGEIEVWMVSPEDLIISKIAWIQQLQSDKQISDIKNLLSVPDIDLDYIKHWCNKLQLNTFSFVKI